MGTGKPKPNNKKVASDLLFGTFAILAMFAFFMAAGIFTAVNDWPGALEYVGGLCFLYWWLPLPVGFAFRLLLFWVAVSSLGLRLIGVGCILLLFSAVTVLTASSFFESDLVHNYRVLDWIANFVVSIWWFPGALGITSIFVGLVHSVFQGWAAPNKAS